MSAACLSAPASPTFSQSPLIILKSEYNLLNCKAGRTRTKSFTCRYPKYSLHSEEHPSHENEEKYHQDSKPELNPESYLSTPKLPCFEEATIKYFKNES